MWVEHELSVYAVRRWEPTKGKTGKGILGVRTGDRLKDGTIICGQYRAVDVEDIVKVSNGPSKT